MKIVPAILETDKGEFARQLSRLAAFADQIQIDLDDGSFGGTTTAEIGDIKEEIKKYSDRIYIEAHLMVRRPLDYLVGLQEAGVQKVIIQAEKEGELRSSLEEYAYQGFIIGLGLAPDSDVSIIEPFLEMIDSVLIFTIAPGHQGNPFLPDNLKKIKSLGSLGFAGEIEVDGGIDETNVKLVYERGADIAVVGHVLSQVDDPETRYRQLVKLTDGS